MPLPVGGKRCRRRTSFSQSDAALILVRAARISATLPPPSSQAPAAAAPAADSGEPEPEPQAGAFPPLTNVTIREAVEAFCEEGGGKRKADFLHSPQAEAKYGPVVAWNVSAVTSMRELFKDCAAFDQPIGEWTVGQVTDMGSMFAFTAAFDQPIGEWAVGQVTDMWSMFNGAAAFNQPIGEGTVGQGKDMRWMFDGAAALSSKPVWCKQ